MTKISNMEKKIENQNRDIEHFYSMKFTTLVCKHSVEYKSTGVKDIGIIDYTYQIMLAHKKKYSYDV